MVLTVLVVSQVEVVLEGVAKHEDEACEVQQRLSSSVVAVEELGLVTADKASWLDGWRWSLWECLVELDDGGQSLGGRVGADVVRGGDLRRDQGGQLASDDEGHGCCCGVVGV